MVVTYDSEAAVAAALPALVAQLRPDDELVIVDNGSADGTLERVRALAPAARCSSSAATPASPPAPTRARAPPRGDLLLFLNPDATPAPGFAEAIRAPLAGGRGWDAWMGLVTAAGGRVVNTSGGIVHFTGIAWAGEAGVPAPGSATGPREVAFASGACLAVPRATWERLGGFPEHYFMYHEDVDLSLRIRLAGGRVGIEPAAGSTTTTSSPRGRRSGAGSSATAGRRSCAATRGRCSRCSPRRCWRPSSRCCPRRRPAAGCRRSCARGAETLAALPSLGASAARCRRRAG